MNKLKRKKETWILEEFIDELERHMWNSSELSDDYREGFSEAIRQIESWIASHKQILEAPNGGVISFVETRDKW